ncbi:MAG: aminoacyl-tRNA deacylase [Candidatus Nanohalobium sp.]
MKYFEQTPEELEQFLDFLDEDMENVKRVKETVEEEGLDADFMVHAKAETVKESAENTGVDEEKIVKTLIFIGERPVAVLCPGHTSVSEEKLEDVLDSSVRIARPDEVEEATGYFIGGVSPFDLEIPVYMEEEILEHEKVKPAAGSRVVGVTVDPEALKEINDAEVVDVSR